MRSISTGDLIDDKAMLNIFGKEIKLPKREFYTTTNDIAGFMTWYHKSSLWNNGV